MSHFTQIQTQMRNIVALKKAIADLGYTFTESTEGVQVRGWHSSWEVADIAINTGTEYQVGVRLDSKGNAYFIGDWWALEEEVEEEKRIHQNVFMSQLTQRYAYHALMDKMKLEGFTLEEEKVEKDATISLKISKWEAEGSG
jgi:hypothetical protein